MAVGSLAEEGADPLETSDIRSESRYVTHKDKGFSAGELVKLLRR